MANFIANATGNLSASGGNPLATVEAGSGAFQVTVDNGNNTTTSKVASTAFTFTNAHVCDGVLLHCKRLNNTGTITISIALSGTNQQTVTVNAPDLPANAAWVFFKFGSTVTGDGSANWTIGVIASSAANATFYGASTNWARLLRLTTTGTPGTTDTLWIAKELTGAGAATARTIYMDVTCTAKGRVTAIANNGGLFRITSASHGRSTSDVISLQNSITQLASTSAVQGLKADCGKWTITVINANTFDLQSSTYVAGYTCGGIWYLIPTSYGEINVCFGGTLQWGVSTGPASSTDYYLALNGNLNVWDSGTVNIGTSGTRIPANGTAHLEFLSTTPSQYGIEAKVGSTFGAYGDNSVTAAAIQLLTNDIGGGCAKLASGALVRYEGQSFAGLSGSILLYTYYDVNPFTISSVTDADHMTLTTSPLVEPSAIFVPLSFSSTVHVASTTGMAAGDVLLITESLVSGYGGIRFWAELAVIASVDSSTQVTLVAPLQRYHAGGSKSINGVPLASHVAHLTRNCVIRGVTGANAAYVNIEAVAQFTLDHVETYQLGSLNSATKRGIEFVNAANINITYSSQHDYGLDGAFTVGFYGNSTDNSAAGTISYTHNIVYNIGGYSIYIPSLTGSISVTDNLVSASQFGYTSVTAGDIGSTYDNNIICCGHGTGDGLIIGETNLPDAATFNNLRFGSFANITCYGGGRAINVNTGGIGVLGPFNIFRASYGVYLGNSGPLTGDITIDRLTTFGVLPVKSVSVDGPRIAFTNGYFDGGPAIGSSSTYPSSQMPNIGYDIAGRTAGLRFESCRFSPVNSLGNDILIISNANWVEDVTYVNCTFAAAFLIQWESPTGALSQQGFQINSKLAFEKFNQIAGQNFTFYPEGTIAQDSIYYDPSSLESKAERLQPCAKTYKLKSGIKKVAISSGGTVTVSCLVRQSVSSDAAQRFGAATISPNDGFNSGAYSGSAPRLMCRYNLAIGIGAGTPPADVVLATLTPVTGSITGATNASPIVITSNSHGLSTGDKVGISGVGGNTNANGNYVVTVINANTFSLNGRAGNSNYTSGGNFSKWVTLSGTTATANDDGVLEFYVDCGYTNGSTPSGYITVDSWSVSSGPTDSNGTQKYWLDGAGYDSLQAASSGGGMGVLIGSGGLIR